ncbi:MAG: phosphoribosylanthranilate isomerase [Desulfohalobiaceae bacterium]
MRIKVCGLTRQRDIDACREFGAHWAGFIFHPESKRHIHPERAASLETGDLVRVGVLVRQDPEEALSIMRQCRLDLVQLHGDQDPAFCRRMGPERVIRTFWPQRFEREEDLQRELDRYAPCCDWFLLDAGLSGGGHGKRIEAEWLAGGLCFERPWLLAGGLGPESIGAGLSLRPDGVDLNSGVEAAPGIKDRHAIAQTLSTLQGEIR